MKRTLLLLALIMSLGVYASGQTTATNFIATDCNGTTHNLYQELDNGKIIVLVWVEPCSGCISDAKEAMKAATNFATSYPNRVFVYLSDDDGGTPCGQLSSWASANGMSPLDFNITLFGNAGDSINEANYGGMGMPHVVVMGGTNHKIYCNILNSANDSAAIRNSIAQALGIPTSVPSVQNEIEYLSAACNPSASNIHVTYSLTGAGTVYFDIIGANGNIIQHLQESGVNGKNDLNITPDRSLSPGIYYLKMTTRNSSKNIAFTVLQ
jgi:hypothetical protein